MQYSSKNLVSYLNLNGRTPTEEYLVLRAVECKENGYRLWDNTDKIILLRDVQFDEMYFVYQPIANDGSRFIIFEIT